MLARNLRCATPSEAFEAGGVFALIGATGVGKTTTTAKIAARHVLKHGPQSVALITVDTYRLGAHDQLRAFGRILGEPVHIAHDAAALHAAGYHAVLVGETLVTSNDPADSVRLLRGAVR